MSLRGVLLVTLRREPGSGYDVLQRFKAGMAHVWHASHQQVYRELDKMRNADLVRCESIAQQDRPDKKIYSITELGINELHAWLSEPLDHAPVRSPLFAKFFAWEVWPEEAREKEFQTLKQELEQRLAMYKTIETMWFSAPEQLTDAERAPLYTLQLGQRLTHTWLVWVEERLNTPHKLVKSLPVRTVGK